MSVSAALCTNVSVAPRRISSSSSATTYVSDSVPSDVPIDLSAGETFPASSSLPPAFFREAALMDGPPRLFDLSAMKGSVDPDADRWAVAYL